MISTSSFSRIVLKRLQIRDTVHFRRWLFGMLSITLVTAIWGYSNVVMRQGEADIAPSVLLWMRFGLAGVLFIPSLIRKRLPLLYWLLGLGAGSMLGLSVLAQGLAMLSIPVDEVAFVTALYVVFTPIGVSILQRKWPRLLVLIAVGISLLGVALMVGRLSMSLQIGVLWAFLSAIGLSIQIIGTTHLTTRVTSVQLAGLQSLGAGLTLTVVVLLQGITNRHIYRGLFHWSPTEWAWILYLAIVATVIAVFLQVWGQARISATEAALAFNMEAVWTALFAWIILSQGMTMPQILGAILILSSLTLAGKPTST